MQTKEEIETECRHLTVEEVKKRSDYSGYLYEKSLKNERENPDKLRERQLEAMYYRLEWLKKVQNKGSSA